MDFSLLTKLLKLARFFKSSPRVGCKRKASPLLKWLLQKREGLTMQAKKGQKGQPQARQEQAYKFSGLFDSLSASRRGSISSALRNELGARVADILGGLSMPPAGGLGSLAYASAQECLLFVDKFLSLDTIYCPLTGKPTAFRASDELALLANMLESGLYDDCLYFAMQSCQVRSVSFLRHSASNQSHIDFLLQYDPVGLICFLAGCQFSSFWAQASQAQADIQAISAQADHQSRFSFQTSLALLYSQLTESLGDDIDLLRRYAEDFCTFSKYCDLARLPSDSRLGGFYKVSLAEVQATLSGLRLDFSSFLQDDGAGVDAFLAGFLDFLQSLPELLALLVAAAKIDLAVLDSRTLFGYLRQESGNKQAKSFLFAYRDKPRKRWAVDRMPSQKKAIERAIELQAQADSYKAFSILDLDALAAIDSFDLALPDSDSGSSSPRASSLSSLSNPSNSANLLSSSAIHPAQADYELSLAKRDFSALLSRLRKE